MLLTLLPQSNLPPVPPGNLSGFARLCTLTGSIKRSTVDVNGKKPVPTTYISNLKCTPLDPVSPDLVLLMGLSAAGVLLQTFVQGNLDVEHGDVLNVTSVDKGIAPPYTIVGKDYPIRGVQSSQWRNTVSTALIVEYIAQPTP